MTSLLEIRGLSVEFATDRGPVEAVNGLDLEIGAGEIVGLVGESGSGKSVTALAVLRLIRPPGRITRGAIRLAGRDLLGLEEDELRTIRGARIALVPQSPRSALNPVICVGRQIARLVELHGGLSAAAAWRRAGELLERVGVADPARRLRQYAHQLSGGTCQRVMIAMALASEPELLIADEPTTGLDASIAARVLDLLRELGTRTGASILLITHDLGVVAETCDRVAVMHAGQLVETAPVAELFHRPAHPYTNALVRSIPRIDRDVALEPIPGAVPALLHAPPGCRYAERCPWTMDSCRLVRPQLFSIRAEGRAVPRLAGTASPATPSRCAMAPLLEVERLAKSFRLRGVEAMRDMLRGIKPEVRAVDGISFSIARGETLGLVGESGCGKSTAARCLLRLIEPSAGRVVLGGQEITALDAQALRRARSGMQMVFQDPASALNPRLTARRMVEEPLWLNTRLSGPERRWRGEEVLDAVGLGQELADRYPHELSGGQRQRVNIARAIATDPAFVVLDEPTSALDVSLRSRIILLLERLRERLHLSYLFISHDIATVKYLARRVAVMYLGVIVELAPAAELFARPLHPYTRALLSAVPIPEPASSRRARFMLSGEVPSALANPRGCRLRGRCPLAQKVCAEPVPLREIAPGHFVACHLV